MNWPIFIFLGEELFCFEDVSPLDEAFSEAVEKTRDRKVPRVKSAEEIKVNFLQVIGCKTNRLLEFFTLKLLNNLGLFFFSATLFVSHKPQIVQFGV